jgi:hypothetical protein
MSRTKCINVVIFLIFVYTIAMNYEYLCIGAVECDSRIARDTLYESGSVAMGFLSPLVTMLLASGKLARQNSRLDDWITMME